MDTLSVVLAVLLGVFFGGLGGAKIIDAKPMRDLRRHLGVARQLFGIVGGFELLGGIGLLVGLHEDLLVVGVLAAVGLVALSIGAGFYHHRAGDPMRGRLPAVSVGSLSIFYVIARIASG